MGYFGSTIKGISWSGTLRLFTRIISIGKIAVIARVLNPLQFGAFGIASIVLSFVEILTETGINVFLVQENEDIKKYLNTAWIVSISRGILISLIIIASIPFVSNFFDYSGLSQLLLLIAVVPLIRGFINPAIVKFQKDLTFNKEFYFRSAIFLVDSLVAVMLVLITRTTESLIIGFIAGAITEVILSFAIIKPTPSFSLEKDLFKKVISRGKWITAAGVFNYLFHNGDDWIVGRILGTSSLGLYQMAYKISMLPITEVSDVVSKVTFPVYTKISDDNQRLKRAFLKITLGISIATIPMGVLFFLFSKQIIEILLGSQWVSIVPILQVLVVFGVIRAISGSASSLFYALKKQEYVMVVTLVSFVVLILSIIPLIKQFGIVGAGIAAVIASIAAVPVVIYYLIKIFQHEKS